MTQTVYVKDGNLRYFTLSSVTFVTFCVHTSLAVFGLKMSFFLFFVQIDFLTPPYLRNKDFEALSTIVDRMMSAAINENERNEIDIMRLRKEWHIERYYENPGVKYKIMYQMTLVICVIISGLYLSLSRFNFLYLKRTYPFSIYLSSLLIYLGSRSVDIRYFIGK